MANQVKHVLEAEKESIIQAYQSGQSLDDLSQKYNCSNTPIRRFLIRNGIPFRQNVRPEVLAEHESEIVALYESGLSTKELAVRFKADRNTVSLFLKKRKLLRGAPLNKRTFHIEADADKGMFAGLLLGEGSIMIRGNGASVRIVNQDVAILGWLSRFGGRTYWSKPRPPRCPNPCGVWDLSGAVDVFHCLKAIHPLLVGKKKQLARAALNVLAQNYGLKEIA